MKNLLMKRAAVLALVVAMLVTTAAGCSSNNTSGETKQSQTGSTAGTETQGQSDETQPATEAKTENDPIDPDAIALTVGDTKITAAELFYYYYALKGQLEAYSGITDWSMDYGQGMSYADVLKQMVETNVLNVAFLTERQADFDVTLTDEDKETIENGVTSFVSNVPEEDRQLYGLNEENVKLTMEHSIIASKVLAAEVEKLTSELTDEEKADCVFRTVQHILFKTEAPAETGESGTSETTSAESYKEAQKAKAEEVLARAQGGEDFETLAEEFNEDNGFEYSFNKAGKTPDGSAFVQEFVDGGNALKEGEMAIVETEYGYHIIKCISENNEELKTTAEETAAKSKLDTIYMEWYEAAKPEFYDVWLNYAVLNPVAKTDESNAAETNESATGETTGTEETQATTESGSADQTGASETNAPETAQTEETQN